jgi:6-phosphogluconolactonase
VTRRVLGTTVLLLTSSLAMASSHLIYLGTYTRPSPLGNVSKGIYTVRLDDDTGALSEPMVAAEAPSPAWVTLSPDKKFLYAIHESPGQAIGFKVDGTSGKLTPLAPIPPTVGNAPSHLAVDATGRVLLAANYRDGFAEALPIHADGTLGAPNKIQHSGSGPNKARQEKSHVHSATLSPDNRFVIFCDLGVDKIYSYALDTAAAKLTPANPPFVVTEPGAGPRHFKFGADGKHAYAINELKNTIAAYDYDAARGALSPIQVVSTLPSDFKGETTCAEVRVHPNGKFLYGSNRGHDSIAVFAIDPASGRLTPVEITPSGGKVPRNFAFSPNGKWLVCAHQDSDNLTVFRVHAATGKLTRASGAAKVPMCVCVLFFD